MPWNIYDLGKTVRVRATFKNGDTGDPIDPDVVNVTLKSPAGALTTYTHGVGSNVVKESVGNYYAMVSASLSGFWKYRWWSAGFGQTAKERKFQVRTAEAVE
jgi:hypothetical protein